MATTKPEILIWNDQNITSPEETGFQVITLVNSLVDDALRKQMLFKADNRPAGNGFRYGLVQCRRDINHTECHNCLKNFVAKVLDCCQMKIAFLIVNPSCNLRYDDNSFIEQPPALLRSPPQSGNAKIVDFYFTWQFPLHIFALLNCAIS